MKVTCIAVFSLAYLAAVYALPARPQDAEEIEFVPLEANKGGHPVVTTAVGDPFGSPFDGLFESFAAMMARLRQQMDYLLGRLPTNGTNFPFPGIPEVDLSKGNTTSVTKIIDGHKVVINETEYKQEGELGGSYFKVRIIDVLPDSSEMTTEKNAETIPSTSKDVESVENSNENEVLKNRDAEVYSHLETFDEPDDSLIVPFHKTLDRSKLSDTVVPLERLEDNSIDYVYPYPPRDLSRDTYVNKLMADSGAPINPDAEIFSSVESNIPPYMQGRRYPFEKIMYPR